MNYGVIGNCQVAALIDEQARMVWACLPRPDGDPVFSALLMKEGGDSDKGVFAIDMVDLTRTEQNYLRNSAILETRMYDAHGGVHAHPRFFAAFSHARPCIPPDDVRARGGAGVRPSDAAPAAAAHRRIRRAL